MHVRAALMLICAAMASPAAHAYGTEPQFAAYAIPGVFQEDKQGDYDKILSLVSTMIGRTIAYEALPPKRVENGFAKGTLDCVIPLDRRFWDGKGELINSEPLNVAEVHIFSRKGDGPYTSLEQLKGKTIGARLGMPYGPKAKDMQAELVSADDQNVKMLGARRIDAFLAYFPDMNLWAKEKKLPLPNHAKEPFETHKDSFLCHDTPATREFLKVFDEAVTKLRTSGQLKKMLGDAFVQ